MPTEDQRFPMPCGLSTDHGVLRDQGPIRRPGTSRPIQAGGQAFAAGLVDEVRVDLVPVVFGAGVRFFGDYAGSLCCWRTRRSFRGDRVTHLHYRLRKP